MSNKSTSALSGKMTKAQAGSKGGQTTVAKYGRDHMSAIGRNGAAVTWKRYHLVPVGVSGWAMVHKETGEVKTTFNNIGLLSTFQAQGIQVTEF